MSIRRIVSVGSVVFIVFGCADGRDTILPTAPSRMAASQSVGAAASADGQVQTSGAFDALVDFSTVTLTPRGSNCLLTVQGRLVFHGTIEGTANGTTSALEFAPCSEVATNPPGTFPDVFKFVGVFDGTVAGEPAHANLRYMGRVQVGGAIDGRFIFSNGVAGRLDVESRVAVGGTYDGSVVVHPN
jgi:hypothetical protein